MIHIREPQVVRGQQFDNSSSKALLVTEVTTTSLRLQ